MKMRVGITYNLRKDFPLTGGEPIDALEEFDSEETIDAIGQVLQNEGHEVVKLGGDRELIDRLRRSPVDLVFNIAEGLGGRNREAHIPALLEFLGIPHTGSDPLTLSLTLDKSIAKKVLVSEGISTPRFKKIERLQDIEELTLPYPLIVKLCHEGSSKGIRLDSRVKDLLSLREKARWLLETYRSPVLLEEFIQGPEFTVGILEKKGDKGNENPFVLGVMQIEIQGIPAGEAIYSLEIKREWKEKVKYLCPPPIDVSLLRRIEEVALRSYRALECRDVSRVDIRVGPDGEPYFLEINPLPGLSPTYGDLPIMARRMGWTYDQLVLAIFHNALRRYGLSEG